tara:strand:+ start:6839 stop:7342 length:504 start_codon:yes stop_codon:yes gene_type:complete
MQKDNIFTTINARNLRTQVKRIVRKIAQENDKLFSYDGGGLCATADKYAGQELGLSGFFPFNEYRKPKSQEDESLKIKMARLYEEAFKDIENETYNLIEIVRGQLKQDGFKNVEIVNDGTSGPWIFGKCEISKGIYVEGQHIGWIWMEGEKCEFKVHKGSGRTPDRY